MDGYYTVTVKGTGLFRRINCGEVKKTPNRWQPQSPLAQSNTCSWLQHRYDLSRKGRKKHVSRDRTLL